MTSSRYPVAFSNLGETEQYDFPMNRYDASFSQSLRIGRAAIIGQPYATRLQGASAGIKDIGTWEVRLILVGTGAEMDAQLALIEARCYGYGLGYLHLSDGSKAQASLQSMPELSISYNMPRVTPIILVFECWEDFF